MQYQVQRFRGGWAVVWHDAHGTRRRHRLYAPDRLGAEAEARKRIALGTRPDRTLSSLVPAYIAAREADGIVSAQRLRDAWKAAEPLLGRISADHLDEATCRAYARQRGRAAGTIRKELGLVAWACAWAERERIIDRRPAIWLPPLPERIDRHISREQFARFLAEIRAPHARLYAVLGITTAGRPAAILALKWQQVDLQAGLVRLNAPGRVQTAKVRATVPIPEQARADLVAAWEARQSDYVIEHGGKAIASVKTAFRAASARSGVQVTPYTLRHSAAVWMAEDRVPMSEIAAYLGHADSRTTERHYAKFSPDYLRKAAGSLRW